MNANYSMTYLTGGDDYFGPNFGGAVVDTNVRAGYVAECPNQGKLLTNLVFSLPMENEIMGAILNDGTDPAEAAKTWLAAHPDAWKPWLDGVTSTDGKPAIVQSRAMDDTGYVQPDYRQLRAVRGTRSIYHNNAIQSWLVQENGEVKNVQLS